MSNQLSQIKKRYQELKDKLSNPEIIQDSKKSAEFFQEYGKLEEIIKKAERLEEIERQIAEAKDTLAKESDLELITLAQEELNILTKEKKDKELELSKELESQNPIDQKEIILEIRAGTGGEEAALFAADLFRMYSRYAENKGWGVHLLSSNRTELGGLKEVISEIRGRNAYGNLKYESGVHRIQRIPKTEKSGRIHTSTATVAVLPKVKEVEVQIKPQELNIETFRASGHGGQHVNVTDSAVRITHLPTGIIASCQNERSQQQNKAKALEILRARLFAKKQEELEKKQIEARRAQIGTAERAEKIRTYNFPQDRITDHRLKKSWYNIGNILDGNLESIIKELKK